MILFLHEQRLGVNKDMNEIIMRHGMSLLVNDTLENVQKIVYSDDVSVCSQFWHACTTYGHIIEGRGCRHAYLDFCWAKIDFLSQYRL